MAKAMDKNTEEIIMAYKKDTPVATIMRKYHLNPALFYKILWENGIPLRGKRSTTEVELRIMAYVVLHPLEKASVICKKFSVSSSLLYRILAHYKNPKTPGLDLDQPEWYSKIVEKNTAKHPDWVKAMAMVPDPATSTVKRMVHLKQYVRQVIGEKVVRLYKTPRTAIEANLPVLEHGEPNPYHNPNRPMFKRVISMKEVAKVCGISLREVENYLKVHNVARDRSIAASGTTEKERIQNRISILAAKLQKLSVEERMDPEKVETPEEAAVEEPTTPVDVNSWF